MAARLSWASVRLNVLAASLSVMKRPQNAWVDSAKSARGIRHPRNPPICVPPAFGFKGGAALSCPMPNFVLLDTNQPDIGRQL